jgi:hypothetical protein
MDKLTTKPFQAGEKVRPHVNFKRHVGHEQNEVTIKSCERGVCSSGWLVTIQEWKKNLYQGDADYDQYDSTWFFKIKK